MIDPTEVERYKSKWRLEAATIVIGVLCVAVIAYMVVTTYLLDFMLVYETL